VNFDFGSREIELEISKNNQGGIKLSMTEILAFVSDVFEGAG